MGVELNIEKIECFQDCYQINFKFEESKESGLCFIRKDALMALLTVAEKEAIETGSYQDN